MSSAGSPYDSYDEISVASGDEESEAEVDISSSLAGPKARTKAAPTAAAEDGEDDDELADFIHTSIAKRDVKGGTEVLKKAKGKGKLAKGEAGGGSFQSMGAFPCVFYTEGPH
jgi:ATP-dependent RNA helicase DDX54/DBP10